MSWRYKLDTQFSCTSKHLAGIEFENEWMTIKDSTIVIKVQYAWDGCTPAYKIPGTDIWLGVWDGPVDKTGRRVTWMATLVHDALCQYSDDIRNITKEQTVALFKELLKANKAPWWMCQVYPLAVDAWGPQKWG